ncbi:MAG: hypothetical protein JWO45_1348 [Spartobacteria bacterium]|nr:hypothetical protein [Spartobacteria bacterium]
MAGWEGAQARGNAPTTRDCKAGAVWTFVATKKSGSTERFTFRVTDEIAKLARLGPGGSLRLSAVGFLSFPAAIATRVFNRRQLFVISLLAPWCDIDDDIRGRLADETFTGDRTRGGIMGSDLVGTVRGCA